MSDSPRASQDIDLAHYLELLLRRRWVMLSAWAMVFSMFALYVFTARPVYQADAVLVIEKERGGGAVTSNGAMVESSNEDYYQTQYKLLKSRTLIAQVYGDLKLKGYPEFAGGPRALEAAVSVAPVLRSRLLSLRVESYDPELAARIANAVAEKFIAQNLANQLFISKEVLQALQVKTGDVEAAKIHASLPAVVNNQLIQQFKGELARLQVQYADLQAKYMPKHPAIVAVRSSIAAVEAQIRAETDKVVQSFKAELSGQLKGNNVRIVDPAETPRFPVRPKKLFILLMGMVCGLAAGLGAAFLLEIVDQSIRTQDDVERRLNLPFLGMIPLGRIMKGASYGALLTKDVSVSSEAVRNLRTMIDFAGVSGKAKVFLVTSAVQDEGKSYVASNLAVAFSQLGEKVLLINGDLRRPTVEKLFAVSSERGLSDFLATGRSVEELPGLILHSPVENLSLLPCGPRPPNPSELLNTPRVAALVSWARAHYDRVIVDCTPMFPIHDTLLWGRSVTSAVFVIRYGRTRAALIQKACQRVESGGLKILGAVVNAGTPGGLTYANYGYTYQQYYHAYNQETSAGKSA